MNSKFHCDCKIGKAGKTFQVAFSKPLRKYSNTLLSNLRLNSHFRISSTDSKVRTTLYNVITNTKAKYYLLRRVI